MKKHLINFFYSLVTLITVLSPNLIRADEVTIVSDRWYPYNGTPQSPNPGYMIEIARHGLEKGGHSLRYQLMSWDRALKLVREGQKCCVVGAYKSEAKGFVFPDIHQGIDQIVFVRRKGDTWLYKGVDSLKQVRLGSIQGYAYVDGIESYIRNQKVPGRVKQTRGKFALEENLLALINGDLDVVIDSQAVLAATIKKQGWGNVIEFAGKANVMTKLYVACSPVLKESTEYVKLIEDATKDLRASGQLEKILEKYGLTDWYHVPAIDN